MRVCREAILMSFGVCRMLFAVGGAIDLNCEGSLRILGRGSLRIDAGCSRILGRGCFTIVGSW